MRKMQAFKHANVIITLITLRY